MKNSFQFNEAARMLGDDEEEEEEDDDDDDDEDSDDDSSGAQKDKGELFDDVTTTPQQPCVTLMYGLETLRG